MMMKRSKSQPAGGRTIRDHAYAEIASSDLARDVNRDLVLERVRAAQPISRVDLARLSGLQPSTVSLIVEQLLQEGWVCEGAVVKTARGRRPTMVSLNTDLVILAADVRPGKAIIAVVDLNGHFLSRTMVPLPHGAVQGIAAVGNAMEKMRAQHPQKQFEGAGLAVPGRVDPETNRLALSPNLGWDGVDICGPISRQLGIPVELENDANACLLSELWFGHVDRIRNAVLVAISEGVGAAVLAEGRLVTGRSGLAGEFGHICVDPNGPVCGCGKSGCWEVFASSGAAIRHYEFANPGKTVSSSTELVALAMSGDETAVEAIKMQGAAIGRGLRMINAALSPDVIFFAGDVTMQWELLREAIQRECTAGLLTSSAPRLISTGDGELALLRGAAAVVLQRHSGYYRASHPKQIRAKFIKGPDVDIVPRHFAVAGTRAYGEFLANEEVLH